MAGFRARNGRPLILFNQRNFLYLPNLSRLLRKTRKFCRRREDHQEPGRGLWIEDEAREKIPDGIAARDNGAALTTTRYVRRLFLSRAYEHTRGVGGVCLYDVAPTTMKIQKI